MLKAFIFSWTDEFDGVIEKRHVMVLAENIESARSHLLENYLKRFRSEWHRSSNEDIAKSVEAVQYELKQGVLWYNEVVLAS